MPVVDIGPWGKDLQKFGERAYQANLEDGKVHLFYILDFFFR